MRKNNFEHAPHDEGVISGMNETSGLKLRPDLVSGGWTDPGLVQNVGDYVADLLPRIEAGIVAS